MNYLRLARVFFQFLIALGLMILTLSCDEGIMDNQNEFNLFGRVVFRPIQAESHAEFFLFSFDNGVADAEIIVGQDTIPLIDSSRGHYFLEMEIEIGDTINYSITSDYGSSIGQLVIPDTVRIIDPPDLARLNFGEDFDVNWTRSFNADGYFIYLENQNGFTAEISSSHFDTTVTVSGSGMQTPGFDRIWVEAIHGDYEVVRTPFDTIMPKGIIGAAGNFKDIDIVL